MARVTRAPRVKTATRRPLSPERIASAALTFIDAHGVEELSTRKLGAVLGVEGMALYRHYASKDDLLDAVAEVLVLELDVPAEHPRGWRERVRELGRSYRGLARRHPRAFPLLAGRRFNTERALALQDRMFSMLLAEGFTPAQAAEMYRTVNAYCTGILLDELAGIALAKRGAKKGVAAVPAGMSSLAKVHPFLGSDRFDKLFDAGLERILLTYSPGKKPKA